MIDSDNEDDIQHDQADQEQEEGQGGSQSSHQPPPFPHHEAPRVWFITAGSSPIALELTKRLLAHGDLIACGVASACDEASEERKAALQDVSDACGSTVDLPDRNSTRLKIIQFDTRSTADCQTAVAEAVGIFGRIDILLCCHSEALIGTIEELSQSPITLSLITSQMQTNFYGPVNMIKACLPAMRSRRSGHVVALTGITGHLGTPSLSTFCSAQWALEGYIDSLAYEIAPFNIRTTILQSNVEIGILTNKIISVPPLPAYMPPKNKAPLARSWIGGICDRLAVAERQTQAQQQSRHIPSDASPSASAAVFIDAVKLSAITSTLILPSELLRSPEIASFYPALPQTFLSQLIAETLQALMAVSGHANPPARHIVGHEGVASVKEKLRAVSEEMEEFLAASLGVDF